MGRTAFLWIKPERVTQRPWLRREVNPGITASPLVLEDPDSYYLITEDRDGFEWFDRRQPAFPLREMIQKQGLRRLILDGKTVNETKQDPIWNPLAQRWEYRTRTVTRMSEVIYRFQFADGTERSTSFPWSGRRLRVPQPRTRVVPVQPQSVLMDLPCDCEAWD
jgi:hypothetical protein